MKQKDPKIAELKKLLRSNGKLLHYHKDNFQIEIKLKLKFKNTMEQVFGFLAEICKIEPEYSVVKKIYNDETDYEVILKKSTK